MRIAAAVSLFPIACIARCRSAIRASALLPHLGVAAGVYGTRKPRDEVGPDRLIDDQRLGGVAAPLRGRPRVLRIQMLLPRDSRHSGIFSRTVARATSFTNALK